MPLLAPVTSAVCLSVFSVMPRSCAGAGAPFQDRSGRGRYRSGMTPGERRSLGVVETRELRYFVAVAEEAHVGRAAARLGMAQPPLSRAIAQLERRLGADLFVRTPRGVTLTGAGETLLREGRAALAAVEAAERRTRRTAAADGRATVVLTAKAGASSELVAKLLDAYAVEPGAVDVEVVLSPPGHQAEMLRDGRADVAILHRPFDDTSGFDVEELATEGQVVILPSGHPASTRRSMTLAEAGAIPGLPLPRWPRLDGS